MLSHAGPCAGIILHSRAAALINLCDSQLYLLLKPNRINYINLSKQGDLKNFSSIENILSTGAWITHARFGVERPIWAVSRLTGSRSAFLLGSSLIGFALVVVA